MAEINLDDLAKIFENNTDASKKFFDGIKDGITSAGSLVTDFIGGMNKISDVTKEASDQAKKLFDFLGGFKDTIDQVVDFTKNLHYTNDELKNTLISLTNIGLVLGSGLHPEAFDKLAEGGRGFSASLVDTVGTIEKISGLLSIFPGGDKLTNMIGTVKKFAALAEPARQFEAGMLAAASASGELGDVFNEIGDDMSGLERKMVTFTGVTNDIANAAGLSSKQVGAYASELMQIPGALSTTISLTKDGAEQMNELDVAIKIAAGTGQVFNKVFEDMNHVYREFGTTGKGAAEYVSRLSSASQGLKLPLDLVKTYTQNAADGFRFFGDNSQAAINILSRFGPALKESGLGPKAITDLTQGIARGVANMDMAQRAFVSSSSGGVGGLQGAAQIELLKKQGKADEVQKMVEESLKKQFGGKVTTLEEAATSQSAAAQNARQVQLLTSGPTKIAGSEGEAQAILEAMSKGLKSPAASGVKSPEEALKSSVEKGNSFQERNYNALNILTNFAEKQTQFAAISANNLIRLAGGRENPLVKRAIDEMRTNSSESAATKKIITGNRADAPIEQNVGEALSSSLNLKGTRSFIDSVGKGFDEMTAKQKVKNTEINNSFIRPTQKTNQNSLIFNRNRIAEDMTLAHQPSERMVAGQGNSRNTPISQGQATTVKVMAVCEGCNKKIAEATAIRIVDGKIEKMQRDDTNHAHGAYN